MNLFQSVYIMLLVILDLILFGHSKNVPFMVVQTNKGYVRGTQNFTLFTNKSYYSFKGIPYAAPPIKHLRFKPPVSVKPWSHVMDTFVEGNQCLQPREIFDLYDSVAPGPYIYGDEDCLYLNVYTPRNFAVMFQIPGGSFSEGPTIFYGPDFIVNEDIILVTFAHRLGPFGFMSLGTEEYSGNMAIKDITFALRWVNENIEKFGGDKNRITVAGYSSGATVAHLLLMSEANRYLFHRAIMMSGSMMNIWGANERTDHLSEMFTFAHSTDPSVRTIDDLIRFLQHVNGTYLLENFIQKISYLSGLPRKKIANYMWSPIIKTPYDDNYKLIETSDKLIKYKTYNNSIDTLFGYTSKESIFFVSKEINNPALLKSFNQKYEVQLPLNYDDDIRYETKRYKRIAREIHDFYFGPGVIVDGNTMSQYVDLSSDIWMRYGIDLSARIQAQSSTGKTYFYEFSVDDQLNIVKHLLNVTLPGASVADDVGYLFNVPIPGLYDGVTSNSVARKIINTMSKLWANFMKYGDPSIDQKIKPIRNYEMNFFNITNDGIVTGKNPRAEAMALWNKIYGENYKGFLRTNILNG